MIKLCKIITSEEILADITEDGDLITFDSPVIVHLVPQGDNVGIAFMPWSVATIEGHKFVVNKSHIIFINEPSQEIKDGYCEKFGKIIMPGSHIKLS